MTPRRKRHRMRARRWAYHRLWQRYINRTLGMSFAELYGSARAPGKTILPPLWADT